MAQSPLAALAQAWESSDPQRVLACFADHPDVVQDEHAWQGAAAVAAWAREALQRAPYVRVLLRRTFCDRREPHWWAAEWVWRASADGVWWDEIEQGLIAHAPEGRMRWLRIHSDHSTLRRVTADIPPRPEPWPADVPPRTRDMTYEEILSLHFRHTLSGWGAGNADVVVSCHAPDSLIQTGLMLAQGHARLREMVAVYGAHYADTRVDVHRVIYSGDFLAIYQTWTCTDRRTGVRAADQDINIGVVQDGRFYRWREYFDVRATLQKDTMTAPATSASAGQ